MQADPGSNRRIISTPNAPGAIGPYNQATVAGGVVYTAGQIALDPATGALVGDGDAAAGADRDGGAIFVQAATGHASRDVVNPHGRSEGTGIGTPGDEQVPTASATGLAPHDVQRTVRPSRELGHVCLALSQELERGLYPRGRHRVFLGRGRGGPSFRLRFRRAGGEKPGQQERRDGERSGNPPHRSELMSRIEYSLLCVRISSRSPEIAGVAIENSSRLLMPRNSNSSPALMTNVSPSSLRTKILPS